MEKNSTGATAHRRHNLSMTDRKSMSLTGVDKVISFSPTSIRLSTSGGQMTVTGSGLTMSALSVEDGTLSVGGRVDSIRYTHERSLKGLFS